MSFISIAKKRYCVRDYQDTPVEKEKILQVLEAARVAPSAVNYQPYRFIVITDESTKGMVADDLFIRRGILKEAIVDSNLEEELQRISPGQISSPDALKAVQNNLRSLPVKCIVPGHGPCLKV